MKIAFVLSKCHAAGSSKNVLEVSRHFSKKGHEVHIFANTCDPLGENMRFHKIPSVTSNYLIRESVTSLLETLILKGYVFDVTVSQPARYLFPDVSHVRFITKLAVEQTGAKPSLSSKVSIAAEKLGLAKSRKIIAMSNAVRDDLVKEYNIPEEKISVVYDGVNTKDFSPRNRKTFSGEIRDRLGIDGSAVVVSFVGNPFSRKGVEHIVRALPMINEKNLKVIITGKDDPSRYKEISEKLGVSDKIIWNIGTSREVNKILGASDIFVFPTVYEPFGLVVTEAMASGVPPVVSKCAGAAELIEDGKEGMLLDNPKDQKEIAGKINYLIDNNLFKKMGNAARAKAEQYTWERTAEDMLAVFEDVIKLKKRKNAGC
jgi:UDP-glucose:(heptosyl)LPS alpha-1,3-glucosyltransferase